MRTRLADRIVCWLGRLLPLIVFSIAACAVAVSYFLLAWQLALPRCGMLRWFGLPCPFCGSTRALAAVAAFDVPSAIRLNPLTLLLLASSSVWFLIWSAELFLRRRFIPWERLLERKVFVQILLPSLVLANWIYLCLTLPR